MTQTWHRTSPVAVVFYLIRALKFLVTDGFAMMAPAVAWYATATGGMKIWAAAWFGILAVGGMIWAILNYLRFRYQITDNQVLVRRGVMTREQLNIDFDRVQDTSIDEPFYVRPFKLAVLKLDTAGSAKKEIALAGIDIELANQIRHTLLTFRPTAADAQTPAQDDDEIASVDQVILRRSKLQIARYGLTANGLLWVAVTFGVLAGTVGNDTWSGIGQIILVKLQLGTLFDGSGVSKGLAISGLLVGLPLLLALFSVLGALWKYANYQLSHDGGSFRRSSGLISRQQQTLKRTKAQVAVWKQNAIARYLNITNLQLRLVSAGQEVSGNGMPMNTPAFLVPALTDSELLPITQQFLPSAPDQRPQFSGIDRRYHLKRCLWYWVIPVAGVTTTSTFFLGAWAIVVPLTGLLIAVLTAWLRSGKFGVAVIGATGFVRSGFIGTNTAVFSLRKVQRFDVTTSPGQRRRGLATLHVHMASHSISVPYLPEAVAQQFADLSLYHAESNNTPWF
ncbi:MAG: PH domain-containing protein [Lysobacterales bacterium]